MTFNDLYNVAELFKDNKVEQIAKDIQIIIKTPSHDLEMIDLELHRMTNPNTKFKHTNVVTATINGINFRLEEIDETE